MNTDTDSTSSDSNDENGEENTRPSYALRQRWQDNSFIDTTYSGPIPIVEGNISSIHVSSHIVHEDHGQREIRTISVATVISGVLFVILIRVTVIVAAAVLLRNENTTSAGNLSIREIPVDDVSSLNVQSQLRPIAGNLSIREIPVDDVSTLYVQSQLRPIAEYVFPTNLYSGLFTQGNISSQAISVDDTPSFNFQSLNRPGNLSIREIPVDDVSSLNVQSQLRPIADVSSLNVHSQLRPIAEPVIVGQTTSKQLEQLLTSFNVNIPEDHLNESLVTKQVIEKWIFDIKSLSKEVCFMREVPKAENLCTLDVCAVEVDVVCAQDDQDELTVNNKDIKKLKSFELNEDIAIVILIRSQSIPVVEAKLAVYKNYKHVIDKRNIFLQHVYDEFDEVAKVIADQRLSAYCCFIKSMMNTLTTDLDTIISESLDKPLASEKIKQFCFEIFERTKGQTIGFSSNLREWRQKVAEAIYKKISENERSHNVDKLEGVMKMCRKTVKDLRVILSELEEFKAKLLPVDQNKLIKEWQKRKVIQNESVLLSHPSIVRYIAGQRGDNRPVVKVFLSYGNKEDMLFFKMCCTVPDDTQFEFVNVEKSKEIVGEVEKLKLQERKAPAVDKATRVQLNRIIEEHAEKIYANYSQVIGMRIGKVRRVGDTIQEEPCIVLYCLDKTIIPFGEKPLPDSIAGWPCDVREDFIMFGACPNKCSPFRQNSPDPGCSIGVPSDNASGSVGFLFESRDTKNAYGSGFLTASHVAIKRPSLDLYQRDATFRSLKFKSEDHCIVHPSWEDNEHADHTVGNVVQAYCGNYDLGKEETIKQENDIVHKDIKSSRLLELRDKDHCIEHTPSENNENLDQTVGKIIQINCSKNDLFKKTKDGKGVLGLDFAVIQSKNFRQEGKEILPVVKEDDLTFNGDKVTKKGRTTGTTIGYLVDNSLSVRINKSFPSKGCFCFCNCYAIENNTEDQPFFEAGDSGSGVYVIEKENTLKPLGIAFAKSCLYTAVCKIDKIVEKLNLEIVRYREEELMDLT